MHSRSNEFITLWGRSKHYLCTQVNDFCAPLLPLFFSLIHMSAVRSTSSHKLLCPCSLQNTAPSKKKKNPLSVCLSIQFCSRQRKSKWTSVRVPNANNETSKFPDDTPVCWARCGQNTKPSRDPRTSLTTIMARIKKPPTRVNKPENRNATS